MPLLLLCAGSTADGNRRLLFSIVVRHYIGMSPLTMYVFVCDSIKINFVLICRAAIWTILFPCTHIHTYTPFTHIVMEFIVVALQWTNFICISDASSCIHHPFTLHFPSSFCSPSLFHSLAFLLHCFHFSLASNNAAITSILCVFDRTTKISGTQSQYRVSEQTNSYIQSISRSLFHSTRFHSTSFHLSSSRIFITINPFQLQSMNLTSNVKKWLANKFLLANFPISNMSMVLFWMAVVVVMSPTFPIDIKHFVFDFLVLLFDPRKFDSS